MSQTAIRIDKSLYVKMMSMRGCGRFTVNARFALLVAAWERLSVDDQARTIAQTEPRKTRLETANATK